MWWNSSCGRIELQMTKAQAESASHPGPCDLDVKALSNVPAIKRQVERIDPAVLREELCGYGAWDDEELDDHAANIHRILWLAACDISERVFN